MSDICLNVGYEIPALKGHAYKVFLRLHQELHTYVAYTEGSFVGMLVKVSKKVRGFMTF